MGSMSVGVMHGIKATREVTDLLDAYERGRPWGECPYYALDDGLVGCWVAVHRGDSCHGADLDQGFPFAEFATAAPYAEAHRRAVERWEEFAAWVAAKGITLPPAELCIALTEVG